MQALKYLMATTAGLLLLGLEGAFGAEADQAAALIARCGEPSGDYSTVYNVRRSMYELPGSPMRARVIEYKDRGLRFIFVPTGKFGEPPSHWQLFGIQDTEV